MPFILMRSRTLDLGGGVLKLVVVKDLRRSGVRWTSGCGAEVVLLVLCWIVERERRWVDEKEGGRTLAATPDEITVVNKEHNRCSLPSAIARPEGLVGDIIFGSLSVFTKNGLEAVPRSNIDERMSPPSSSAN